MKIGCPESPAEVSHVNDIRDDAIAKSAKIFVCSDSFQIYICSDQLLHVCLLVLS